MVVDSNVEYDITLTSCKLYIKKPYIENYTEAL